MPEGPSILILKEAAIKYKGKIVKAARGNAPVELKPLAGKKLLDIRTWGKQFFLCFNDRTLRIHLLMFGSYSFDKQTKPARSLRLRLDFSTGKMFFYTCSVRLLDAGWSLLYDWEADVLSDRWAPGKARKKLKSGPAMMVCDALLNQEIFAGVGNIIKNEVLFRIRVHPETLVSNLPPSKLSELIKEARRYSFDFLDWKRKLQLKKHWLAYSRKICPRCEIPFQKRNCGLTRRTSFFCTNCQIHY